MWRICGSEMTSFELRKLEPLAPDFAQPNWTESPSLDPDECVSFDEAMAETPSCVSDDFWFPINLDDLRVRWKNIWIMMLIFFLIFVLRPVTVLLPHYHTIFQTINIGETYLIEEFRDILRIGFLFFLRPEPSLIEDWAGVTSVVVIYTLLFWYV